MQRNLSPPDSKRPTESFARSNLSRSTCYTTTKQTINSTRSSMASLSNAGAPIPQPLSEQQLSLLISLSGSVPAPPQCTMNDIQSILSKISATIAQCRSSLALACSRVASDATCDGTSQVFNRQKYYYLHLHRCRRHHHHLDHRHHRLLFHTLNRLFMRP